MLLGVTLTINAKSNARCITTLMANSVHFRNTSALCFDRNGEVSIPTLKGDHGVSADEFGVVGNGIADDTAALQQWANALAAQNIDGWLPRGTYKISSTIVFTTGTETGRIVDLSNATIVMAPFGSSTALQFGTNTNVFWGHVQGGVVKASFRDTVGTSCGIKLFNVAEATFDSIKVIGFYYNWYVQPSSTGQVAYSTFLNIVGQDCGHTNLLLDNANGGGGYHGELNFFGGRMRVSSTLSYQQHVSISGASNHNRFIGLSCEGNGLGQRAIYVNNNNNTFENCRVESGSGWLSGSSVLLDTSSNNNILIDNRGDFTVTDNGTTNQLLGHRNLKVGASTSVTNRSIGIGFDALLSNTTGTGCVAIGEQALNQNSTGSSNTCVGRRALFLNTTGADNSAVGYLALNSNTTGGGCSAFGSQALTASTGGSNSAFGRKALTANTTGIDSCAFGWNSLLVATTGSRNTGLGTAALGAATTTSDNTAIGWHAGQTPTAPVQCVFVGSGADSATSGITNAAVIGYNAQTSTNNSVTLGNSSVNKVIVGGGLVSAADDTAAAAAGVPLNGLYHTSGAVKIRLV